MKKIFGILFCGCVVFSVTANAQMIDEEFIAKFGDRKKATEFYANIEQGSNQFIDKLLIVTQKNLIKKHSFTEESTKRFIAEVTKRIDKKEVFKKAWPCIKKNTTVSKNGCRTGATSRFDKCIMEEVDKIGVPLEYLLVKDTVRQNTSKQKKGYKK